MSCEICGGRADELARTRKYIWLGCHDCHRTWRDDIRGAVPVLGAGATSREPQHFARAVSIIRGCLLTVGAVALAFGLRSVLRPAIGNASPFLVFTPAVMVTAFYAGPAAGVFATISSALLGSHFFLRTLGEPSIEKWDRVALFLLVGALITILSAVVSKARERLHASLWREQTARAEAEAASQAKDEFLALVSHELQTPASVVLGWASMIRARQLTGQPLVHALDVIERNARMQSKLVEDVLDTSRIVNGTMRLERQRVSLTTIVAAAVEQMRPAIEGHQLQLDLQRASDDWAVLADAVRLQQVFTNLLSNAVKFTPAGGCVSIAMTRADNVATVTVSDNGVGIASAFLPRMFERFEQDSQTLAFSRQGLGLGLSICRHFVEQHGGTITASSEGPGKGAAFAVSLPLDLREPSDERARTTVLPDALRSISVLLVEDDDDTRALLASVLERYGARVYASGSAAEARAMLGLASCNVLLCDLRMPGDDGLAFIREIRGQIDRRLASIPAAAITASGLPEDHQRALAAGYQIYLRKPVEPDDLALAIAALVRPRADA